ncbi:D-cysteine desulfhydrase family protein [Simiduia sp. 21SJ11W-1]|uniref:D-cysteine desulfhydrase family protein n=1 Tax=Simiduia sp. 21SJ11W-1 TaxID=2909669 RepID=UPI0020A10C1F|nr:D-cysteine desulfhydrase family protein [Simiduia sp. 21SJ11W-1]UTA46330.1 D-cysteine desulfhydrase family protein [Simiduia sp. 21SJ11W-1]
MSNTNQINYPARNRYAQTPSPIQPLDRLTEALGISARIWVKRDDLTGCYLSGNKVRKLEFLVAEAQAMGANTLITSGGVQSNHARATALIAAQEGMRCHLLLRGDAPADNDGNLLLDRLAGAEISFFPSHSFEANVARYFSDCAARYAAEGNLAYTIPTGGSNGTGLWGYIGCADEMHQQLRSLGVTLDRIVCATGSGGTQAGLTLGAALCGLSAPVTGIAVCDSSEWFNRKVKADWQAWAQQYGALAEKNCKDAGVELAKLSVHTLDEYIGPGYARAGQEIFETIKLVARTEGLVLDPVYTGKAFYGMLQQLQQGHWAGEKNVLFVHTGGLFGVFPQRSEFVF